LNQSDQHDNDGDHEQKMNQTASDVTDEADNMTAYNQSERALDSALVDSVAAFILADDAR
jgi:hypothetical protein